MNLVLLGAPGSGKGTMSEHIRARLDVPAISTGAILRAAINNGTPEGLAVKADVEAGKLAPDDIVIRIVLERLKEPDCQNGYILDGVPRTLQQAIALDEAGLQVHKALFLNVNDKTVERRVMGRRICPRCGANYHVELNPPEAEGVCDVCGETLMRRQGDDVELLRVRLDVFHSETAPIKDYYAAKKKLISVDSQAGIEDTKSLVFQALGLV